MRYQVAFLKSNNEINHILSTGTTNEFLDGQMYNGLKAVYVPDDIDIREFVETKYLKGQNWETRSRRPSDYMIWENEDWVLNEVQFLKAVRIERDNRLLRSDWTQLNDSPITNRSEWAQYRQELRDLPNNINNAISLEEINWPVEPTGL